MTTHVQAIRRLVVLAMLSLSVFGCGWFGADQPVEKDPTITCKPNLSPTCWCLRI